MATFMDFAVRHRLATISPMENMEAMVSSHTPMYTSTLPCIRYPNTPTAATVRMKVDSTAITPLAMVSQASSLAGEQGLQYILRRIPCDRLSTMVMGMLINALQQMPTVDSDT